MNTLYTIIFRAAFLLSMLLSAGCAAVSYPQAIAPLDPGATLRGMQAAVNGLPGTYILQQGSQYVFGWPSGGQYAWVAFAEDGKFLEGLKSLCGNRACPEAAGDLYNYLVQNGWQNIPGGMLPVGVASTVRQLAYLISIGASLPVMPVLMLPVVIDPIEWITPKVGA